MKPLLFAAVSVILSGCYANHSQYLRAKTDEYSRQYPHVAIAVLVDKAYDNGTWGPFLDAFSLSKWQTCNAERDVFAPNGTGYIGYGKTVNEAYGRALEQCMTNHDIFRIGSDFYKLRGCIIFSHNNKFVCESAYDEYAALKSERVRAQDKRLFDQTPEGQCLSFGFAQGTQQFSACALEVYKVQAELLAANKLSSQATAAANEAAALQAFETSLRALQLSTGNQGQGAVKCSFNRVAQTMTCR